MKKNKVISRLNFFYSFELNQVDLYTAQSRGFSDGYTKLVFERIAYIEQQHVDNIASMIKKLGGRPTRLGDVVSPVIGSIAGRILPLSGRDNALKINIMLEEKAMRDYRSLIKELKNNSDWDELIQVLKFNHVDEDLHAAWFAERLPGR